MLSAPGHGRSRPARPTCFLSPAVCGIVRYPTVGTFTLLFIMCMPSGKWVKPWYWLVKHRDSVVCGFFVNSGDHAGAHLLVGLSDLSATPSRWPRSSGMILCGRARRCGFMFRFDNIELVPWSWSCLPGGNPPGMRKVHASAAPFAKASDPQASCCATTQGVGDG